MCNQTVIIPVDYLLQIFIIFDKCIVSVTGTSILIIFLIIHNVMKKHHAMIEMVLEVKLIHLAGCQSLDYVYI